MVRHRFHRNEHDSVAVRIDPRAGCSRYASYLTFVAHDSGCAVERTAALVDDMTKSRQGAGPQLGRGPRPMPIGEFGNAPALPGNGGALMATPLYWFYEMGHAALNPSRAAADVARLYFKNPLNPWS